jgi:hypothetical protein
MKGTRATTPAAYEFNYEKDHFVFSTVDFALTFGIPNVDSRIHITLHPIPLKLLVNNSSKRPAFVFSNIDLALMFGIPNADSLSTSHFPIPLKTISHNSTDGTKNTYPRLRAGAISLISS